MSNKEELTFFLYGDGYQPQELNLGHLVLGTYSRPTTGLKCPMEPLGEADLEKWANVQQRSSFCYSSHSLRDFGGSATGIDFAKVGASRGKGEGHAVASETCRRVTLKNPEAFLRDKVLAVDSTKETVRTWLSLSTHEHIIRKLAPVKWWPKIWMLTGVYEFEDCTSYTWNTSDVSGEVGVASEIMALLNVPLGADMSIHVGRGQYTKQTFPGTTIWAAQYQLVHPEYLRVPSSERHKQPPEPLHLRLHLKAVYSMKGAVFRTNAKKTAAEKKDQDERDLGAERTDPINTAVLNLAGELSTGQGDASEWEDEFWARFAEAEADWADGSDVEG